MSARTIEADENASLNDLKDLIASHFAIVVADGKYYFCRIENLHKVNV